MIPRSALRVATAVLVCASTLTACAPLPEVHDLDSPTAPVRTAVKTVCLEHVDSDLDLSCCKDRVARYEEELADILHDAGFRVVDADKTEARWKKAVEHEGGYFDTLSGERDEARFARIRPIAGAALRTDLGCEAVVRPFLGIVMSPWSGGDAQWDGAEDEMTGGSWDAFGTVAALSLWLRIESLPGNEELYFRSGGLQVVAGLEHSGFARMRWAMIANEKLLADESRNRKSIRLALEPLLRETGHVAAR